MLYLLIWAIYGIIFGYLAKFIHPGEPDLRSIVGCVMIALGGTLVGGFINWTIGID